MCAASSIDLIATPNEHFILLSMLYPQAADTTLHNQLSSLRLRVCFAARTREMCLLYCPSSFVRRFA